MRCPFGSNRWEGGPGTWAFYRDEEESDVAAFKRPNLRNLLLTAPYFHDGSQATLWDLIDHYNKGVGLKNPSR